MVEEQVIQNIVHKCASDPDFRTRLASETEQVVREEGGSERVTRVVRKMLPQLVQGEGLPPPFGWWR
jgi:hypothetical protein